jgi:hypothetical protein
MGWSKDILLERANHWADKHGYGSVTVDSLLKWRKEGFIPKPKPVGRGWGKGKAEEWSCVAYRRILEILRFKAKGITHRRDQRLILWLAGNDIRMDLIRGDLVKIWETSIKRVGREIGADLWGIAPASEIPRKAKKKISKLFPTPSLESLLKPFGLNRLSLTLIGQLESTSETLEADEMLKGLVYAFINPDYKGVQTKVIEKFNGLTDNTPEKDVAQKELIVDIGVLSGMVSNPEEFYNPILAALEKAPDPLLLNIRDFIIVWNGLWLAVWKLSKSALEYDPKAFLGHFGFMLKPLIGHVLNMLMDMQLIQTPSDKLFIFGFLLRRAVIMGNEANGLKKIADLRLDKVIDWMADNFEMFADEKISLTKKVALVQASPLSCEMKSDILQGLA